MPDEWVDRLLNAEPRTPQAEPAPRRRRVRAESPLPASLDELTRLEEARQILRQQTGADMPAPRLGPPIADVALIQDHYFDGTGTYGPHISNSFRFFRTNHDGHYSDSTMMRLARAADVFNQRQGYEAAYLADTLPWLFVINVPHEYDDETEVKKGGVAGMMAVWQDKAVIAVASPYRRLKVGSVMYRRAIGRLGTYPAMWAGRQNLEGHHFLLKQGLYPSAMNSSGAIRYSRGDTDDD